MTVLLAFSVSLVVTPISTLMLIGAFHTMTLELNQKIGVKNVTR